MAGLLVLLAAVAACRADDSINAAIQTIRSSCQQAAKDGLTAEADFLKEKTSLEAAQADMSRQLKVLARDKGELEVQHKEWEAKKDKATTAHEEALADLAGIAKQKDALPLQAKSDKAEVEKEKKKLQDTLDGIKKAVAAVKGAKPSLAVVRQALALVPTAPAAKSFLQQRGAPNSAAGGEFHSDGVLALLNGLVKEYEGKVKATRTQLENIAANKEVAESALNDQDATQTKLKDAAKGAMDKADAKLTALQSEIDGKGQEIGDLEGEHKKGAAKLTALIQSFDDGKKELADMQYACKDALQTLSATLTGGAEDIKVRQVSSLQVLSGPVQQAVANLRDEAKKMHSKDLVELADLVSQVAQGPGGDNTYKGYSSEYQKGPFAAVQQTMMDMISQIHESLSHLADEYNGCVKQVSQIGEELKGTKSKVDQNQNRQDELQAEVSELTDKVADLKSDISKLKEAMVDMEATRRAEANDNDQAIRDAEKAADALRRAHETLAEKFTQKAYTSMLSMIEGLQQKFVKMAADFRTQESTQKSTFDTELQGKKVEEKGKAAELTGDESKLASSTEAQAKAKDNGAKLADTHELQLHQSKSYAQSCDGDWALGKDWANYGDFTEDGKAKDEIYTGAEVEKRLARMEHVRDVIKGKMEEEISTLDATIKILSGAWGDLKETRDKRDAALKKNAAAAEKASAALAAPKA